MPQPPSTHQAQEPSTQAIRIMTADDLVSACKRSEARNSLVVLKLYSKRCRACNMTAPLFRRLARRHSDAIDCLEVECQANVLARPLMVPLGVTALPSVVVFDPMDVTRVNLCSLAPASRWSRPRSRAPCAACAAVDG